MTAQRKPDVSETTSGVNPRSGIAPKRTPHSAPTVGPAGGLRPKVMARLPSLNLNDEDLAAMTPAPAEPRPLRKRASSAALVAAALIFVTVAALPYLRKDAEGGKPPAKDAPEAPAWSAAATGAPTKLKNEPAPDFLQPDIPLLPNAETAAPPVSIPAVPASIPAVPPGVMGPSAGPGTAPPAATPGPALGSQSAISPALPPLTTAPLTAAPQYPSTPYTSAYAVETSTAAPFQGAANQAMSAPAAIQTSAGSAATMPTNLPPLNMNVPKTAQGFNHDHAGSSLR